MSRHYYDMPGQTTPMFYPSGYNVGVSSSTTTHCTTFKVRYSSVMTDPVARRPACRQPPAVRNQTLLFQLTLRTFGDIRGVDRRRIDSPAAREPRAMSADSRSR